MSELQEQGEMTFLEHLEELRWHIVRSLIAIFIFAILVFIFKGLVFDWLLFGPKQPDFITYQWLCSLSNMIGAGDALCIEGRGFEIVNIEMAGQFLTHLKVSLVCGFIFAFPYIAWECWRFIKPALYENEKKYTRGMVFFTSLLFFIGVSFGYLLLAPVSINFFANYSVSEAVENTIKLTSYISIVTTVVLASGIMFELPMAVYIFSKLDLVTPANMREYRKHAVVGILAIAAIITPADIWTQLLVGIPVYFLYELSIYISAWVHRKAPINS